MIGGFLNKMGVDCSEFGGRGEWQGKGEYKRKRAAIVSNPDIVHDVLTGCIALHDIEVKNNTHWGWKKGCFLGLDSSVE